MDKINIVFAIDNNFIEHLAVTIASILLNSNIEEEFDFHVLDGGITDDSKEKIAELKSIKNFNIQYLKIEEEEFKSCPLSMESHLSKAAYYRFKLPSLLKSDKALYLDCDILVKKSLKNLYNKNIENDYAAVIEDNLFSHGLIDELCRNLGVEKYFNSGVMLLNLKKMRENNIEEKCFKLIHDHPEKIKYHDQCVLNYLFKNKATFIEKKYNLQYNPSIKGIYKEYKKQKKQCVILHFTSEMKPWILETNHPCTFEYYYYLSKTPFRQNLLQVMIKKKLLSVFSFIKKIYLTVKYLT